MRYVHAACAVVATLALCVLVWRIDRLITTVNVQIPTVVGSLQAMQTDTTRTEAEMAGVLNATRKAVLTPAQVKGLVDQASLVLSNTNKSIEHLDDVITEVSAVVPTVNQSVIHITDDTDTVVRGVQPILVNVTKASGAASDAIADPDIKDALTHIDNTSASVEGVARDAKTESDLIVAQTRSAFKPKNKFLAVLQFIGGGTISVAELYYYLTH